MINHVIFTLVFAAAIGCGLVAGIFYAFSSFVMGALGRLPAAHGIEAMQTINVVVINRSFMLAFFGTGAVCVALVGGSTLWWDQASGKLILAAGVIYLVGCIGVTLACNVPLNNALAAVRPGTPEAAALWSQYLDRWTAWNTVRTVAPLVSAALFIAALV
jgi:uncharacterized membrane protein